MTEKTKPQINRADVLRMAKEAGLSVTPPRSGQYDGGRVAGDVIALLRFATKVAAHEPVACDKVCDAEAARIAAQTENEALKTRLAASGVAERRAVREAVLAEREACVRVCDAEAARALFNYHNDTHGNQDFWSGAEQVVSGCADAIRARGAA